MYFGFRDDDEHDDDDDEHDDDDDHDDAQVGMSMMENPNLMDAANFGGPQSPIGEYKMMIVMVMMTMVMVVVMITVMMMRKRRRNFSTIIKSKFKRCLEITNAYTQTDMQVNKHANNVQIF